MKIMKFKTAVCAAALLTVSVPALAEDGGAFSFSGSVTLTTDYVFRGISQTQNDPAIQGDFRVDHESGLFGSVWASNVDFDDGAEDTNLEIDWTLGFANEVDDKFSYEVGVIYYAYPDSNDDYNYWEFYFAPSYALAVGENTLTLSGGVYYSPEFFLDTGDAWYLTAGAALQLTDAISIDANIGHQDIEDAIPDDYTDWNAGATFTYEPWGVDFDVRYIDTNISCVNDICDERVVFSVTKGL